MTTRSPMGGQRVPVAVLGATGTVGQRFVTLLADHPWFEITSLAASERSAGRRYGDAVKWVQTSPLPASLAELPLQVAQPPLVPAKHLAGARVAFSALDGSVAGEIESAFAQEGHLVVSNARSHRMDSDVPLLVPEVNAGHLDLIASQRFGSGAIVTNPNCSTIGLVLALKPLVDAFGVQRVQVVTLQAISGGGLPGVASYEILDNVVPFISGEEEKIETESRRILGRLAAGGVEPAELAISAQCNRVPVVDGHLLCVSVALGKRAVAAEVQQTWEAFSAEPQALALPSAPARPILYLDAPAAPQPRLHRELGGGMAIAVGRLRPCPVLDFRFVALSHNTLRGAAGGALLVAELAVMKGYLEG